MKQARGLRQYSRHFRAMGTEVALWVWNDNEQRASSALLIVERFFAQTEARLSRFRTGSELSRLNRAAGRPFATSPMLFDLVASALAWRDQTGGIFDPAILNALVASGYDRSFSAIRAEQANQGVGEGELVEIGESKDGMPAAWGVPVNSAGILLGPGRQITLPAGVGLDLGGIAKGWTIQQAAQRLAMWGPCLVDAGGDIACVGAPPGEPWVVTVADPRDAAEDIAVLGLCNAAIATSSRIFRSWRHAGRPAHHLIDPRTGAPAATRIESVTVIAGRLPDAEIYAKTALILGEEQGLAYLHQIANAAGAAGLVVTDDGRRLTSGDFEKKAYVSSSSFAERFQIPG
jgi:thiamine biosynthesis lipoprotein